jgi:hypothetical protein
MSDASVEIGKMAITILLTLVILYQMRVMYKQAFLIVKLKDSLLSLGRSLALHEKKSPAYLEELDRCRQDNITMTDDIKLLKQEVRRLEKEKYNG